MRDIIIGLDILLLLVICLIAALAFGGEIANQNFLGKVCIFMGIIVVINILHIGRPDD